MVRRPFASGFSQPKTIGFALGLKVMSLHILTCRIVVLRVLAWSSALASVYALASDITRVFEYHWAYQEAVRIAFEKLYIQQIRDEGFAILDCHVLIERAGFPEVESARDNTHVFVRLEFDAVPLDNRQMLAEPPPSPVPVVSSAVKES